MKYEVELAMTKIDNCWCQKPQLTVIPCDHLIIIFHSEGWITLSMLVHIISSSTILTHDLVIDVVMTINEIDQCTTVRSLGQIQQKSTMKGKGRYAFQ
jgi:hypothetical protein